VSVRYLIISDIHANLDALDAVLAHASGAWDQVLVLGDLVGYGAEPNEVMDRIHGLKPAAVIRGNHDKAACGIDDGSQFNHVARLAAIWTGEQLTDANRDYLRNLPMGPLQIDALLEICHGAPFDEDHYIFDAADARHALQAAKRPLCLFGHTHLPVMFRVLGDGFEGAPPDPDVETLLPIEPKGQYLVNVGSVGQPRDGDPRAGYGILDTDAREIRLRRVVYPVDSAQRKILAAGLPTNLANRLALGR
jgi:diadenosine tetraphosphatase ApaH/serine/threonine PP2A family protein phosphatase